MLTWLSQNWGSLLVGAIVLAIVAVIVWRIVRNRRAGKTVCGGDCAHSAFPPPGFARLVSPVLFFALSFSARTFHAPSRVFRLRCVAIKESPGGTSRRGTQKTERCPDFRAPLRLAYRLYHAPFGGHRKPFSGR